MKILLLGDYSNYHACLGRALAKEGHHVTVASDGSGWMNTSRTISLNRTLPGKAGGVVLFIKMMSDSRFTGFDIVSLINPSFVTLKPARLRMVFEKLRKKNGAIFLGSVGTDKAVMDFLTAPECDLRYSEYYSSPGNIYVPNKEVLDKEREWQIGKIGDFCEFIYDNVAGVTTALYEYHLAMQRRIPLENLAYVGIPIETPNTAPHQISDKPNLFLGRHSTRKKIKGTDRIEKAAKRVANEFPEKCELTIVEDVPYNEYLSRLKEADVVLDQLYSFSPATNALLAMANGQAVLSGGEPEYYDFIGEKELFPIINGIPDDEQLYETIKDMVLNPQKIVDAGAQGPAFVAKHNAAELVARRHIDFWTSKL